MMPKKPKILIQFSAILSAFSVFALLMSVSILIRESFALGSNQLMMYASYSLVLGVMAYLAYWAQPVLYAVFPVVLVIYASILANQPQLGLEMIPLVASNAFLAFCGLVMLKSEMKVAFRLREPAGSLWGAKRRQTEIPVSLVLHGQTRQAKTFDLSETGTFLSIDKFDEEDWPAVGDTVDILMDVGGVYVTLKSKAVRVADEPKGKYPAGVGFSFVKGKSNVSPVLDQT